MPSPVLPDIASMGSVARDLRRHADDLRRHRASLQASCTTARWHSRAATACRVHVTTTLSRMQACAQALDHAASTLDHHARTVDQRRRELEAVAAGIAHAGAGLAHGIGSGLRRATHWMAT